MPALLAPSLDEWLLPRSRQWLVVAINLPPASIEASPTGIYRGRPALVDAGSLGFGDALDIEDMRLVVKFGEKRRYSDWQYEAICQELVAAGLNDEAMRDPDAIEAVFKKLNAADEAEAARRDLRG
jgi:hypothetical protein